MSEMGSPLKLKKSSVAAAGANRRRTWRILVVDDDHEVHSVTRMILDRMTYQDRGVELLDAYSAAEARVILERDSDVAAILLDVVMETDDAGLRLVRTIREEFGNRAVRIILRTGQPGQAPEEQVIIDYDINDYKAKSELTAQKLFTTVIAALRAYETIVSLEKIRLGLERILESTGTLFQVQSMQQFASGVLTQLSAFLGCKPNGVICAEPDGAVLREGPGPCDDVRILASTGEYHGCVTCPKEGPVCPHAEMLDLVRKALRDRRSQFTDQYTVLYLNSGDSQASAAVLDVGEHVDDNDRRLLEVFSSKISLAFANAVNYQKMITAETAATTDFLTGLNNRRQLLRLGTQILAGARRTGAPIGLAMMDIDHFKRVNDTWGHDAGDEVLKRVGELLRSCFRTSDVVARFGGEEFCVLATNMPPSEAQTLFNAFRETLAAQVFEFQGQQVSVSISVGVTTAVGDNLDQLITTADALLYRAKQEGRNRVVIA